ncbi:MAG: carbamoyl-phosphate synthase large subunit [Firmicutes bacterium]|nr:carbamoyl-phosphate synthase large subunit [Alicyclobacillaceae bacterium]MCL6496488.1 carbamoyl-phosphate synthase large subunit [Bacillota bacterium]
MPKRRDLRKVLVIGSGPIIIGQAAEFDYAGTQACRALREEGLEVVLVNSNPATIMTDLSVADVVYLEPLTVSFLAYVLGKERPDGILPTLGGQVGLNLASELARAGILTDLGVELLGTPLSAIEKAEDRELFRRLMLELGQPIPRSRSVTDVEEGVAYAEEIGYPVVLRPAYTLGGSGGGFAHNRRELRERLAHALSLSPIGQVLVEESIAGWKEIEYEVMRDRDGNAITVCNMENLDPVGVHTGDSIVVAPSQTLTDVDYHRLRRAALEIVSALGVEGGCNVQFALNPDGQYRVIEVNPRVSRSSALASKATGYPIARIAAKIAVGLTLPEIPNPVTAKTTAAFEPALDYVVVKIPRWPFDKFPTANRRLGTQMKATGEVMAIDRTFVGALNKAVRSLEVKRHALFGIIPAQVSDQEVFERAATATDDRLFYLAEAIRRGMDLDELHQATHIDRWFLGEIARMAALDRALENEPQRWRELLPELKAAGVADARIAELARVPEAEIRRIRRELGVAPVYKMVDTCAGEFPAATPYYYATYERENEAEPLAGDKVLVLGSGPIRIGQGIEFDAATVWALDALRRRGVRAMIINSNPETVSTDFNASDRLFFDPLTLEDVLNVVEHERPRGVLVQFGGQTAINLAEGLVHHGVPILGTDYEGVRTAEDRRRFDALLERHGLRRPPGGTATTADEALAVAASIGYPVLVRPSFVLGGRAMEIIEDEAQLVRYLERLTEIGPSQPLLLDRYVNGLEMEVDAVSDGERVIIPAVMEHVERAGVHSGDSLAVLPARRADPALVAEAVRYTEVLCRALKVRGFLNVQFVAQGGQLYVIEANPRSSRTVPFVVKATGVPLVELAIEAILEGRLSDRYGYGLLPPPAHYAVKMPVFSFGKLDRVDAALGPEMKSTGEAMGIDRDYPTALYKALLAGGFRLPAGGAILATIADADKEEAVPLLKELVELGYRLFATYGTLARLSLAGIPATPVRRLGETRPHLVDLIRQGTFDLVVNTITVGGDQEREGFLIRRAAVERGVPCFTSLDTLRAALTALRQRQQATFSVHSLNHWLGQRAVH